MEWCNKYIEYVAPEKTPQNAGKRRKTGFENRGNGLEKQERSGKIRRKVAV